ncbi:MAG TPA: NFACT family protein [Thermodesulfobacteriota bacterium]|nr:NFACT family protein [Thermodesulfobacteriota bacterium]
MDLFVIHGIVEELKKEITGTFISKVYQMNRTDLLLRLRRSGDEKQLLLSTHPDFFRLHLTEKKYANPMVPPRFCTYLRKHIGGARVSGVTQDRYERVVRVGLQKMMDAGVIREVFLVAELVGKMSNLLLLEGDKILDCLHFRRGEEGAPRPSAPGLFYVPLSPSSQWAPDEMDQEKMAEISSSPVGERWRAMVHRISGVSPLLARELEFVSDGTPEGIGEKLRLLTQRYEKADFEPRVYTLLGEKKVLSPFPLKSLGPAEEETFPSMNQAADQFYFEVVMKRQMIEQKQSLSKRLRQLISRLQRRQDNLTTDREGFQKDLEAKDYGDILTANYPRIKRGMREAEVLDYRQDPPRSILIPLDESLDPSANVQRYFKKYKKAKRGLEIVSQRVEETEKEIVYLESVLFGVEAAEDAEEVEMIRRELEEERIIPVSKKQKAGKEEKEKSLPVRRFRSSEGLEILCGKHNLGNDYLLRHLAKDNDLWFHSQGLPGSHVLLKTGKGDPKPESILEAATIAAHYSRGSGSTRLPVDYTPVKNVHRPKGAKPGMVTYFHQKTIQVRPDKEKVERLRT